MVKSITLTTMPAARTGATSARLPEGRIIVMGGHDGANIASTLLGPTQAANRHEGKWGGNQMRSPRSANQSFFSSLQSPLSICWCFASFASLLSFPFPCPPALFLSLSNDLYVFFFSLLSSVSLSQTQDSFSLASSLPTHVHFSFAFSLSVFFFLCDL